MSRRGAFVMLKLEELNWFLQNLIQCLVAIETHSYYTVPLGDKEQFLQKIQFGGLVIIKLMELYCLFLNCTQYLRNLKKMLQPETLIIIMLQKLKSSLTINEL